MLDFINVLTQLIEYIYLPFNTVLTNFGIDLNIEWINGISYDQLFFTIHSFIVYYVAVLGVVKFIMWGYYLVRNAFQGG